MVVTVHVSLATTLVGGCVPANVAKPVVLSKIEVKLPEAGTLHIVEPGTFPTTNACAFAKTVRDVPTREAPQMNSLRSDNVRSAWLNSHKPVKFPLN